MVLGVPSNDFGGQEPGGTAEIGETRAHYHVTFPLTEKVAVKGTVKVALEVGGDGAVRTTNVVESPDESLGQCVAAALKAAQFAKTTNGGTFTYPFVF